MSGIVKTSSADLRQWLRKTAPGAYHAAGRFWRRYSSKTIYNVFNDSESGRRRALLSYLPVAFREDPTSLSFLAHQNRWECREIGLALRDKGYVVDVVAYDSDAFSPRKKYDMVVDVGFNLDRFGHLLPESCLRVVHGTGNHWLFQNAAELKRLADLKARRGVVLMPRRMVPATFADLSADALIIVGNAFTRETFSHVTCPVHVLQVSIPRYSQPDAVRSWTEAKRSFMWMGSHGAVHKGLDLVLEAFTQLPELHLHVVGAIEQEVDFFEHYRKELLDTGNITYHGYVHHASDAFSELARSCCALVYPSCSDANPGAAIASMFRGLIPIMSRESGLDVGEDGIVLTNCSVPTICDEIRRISLLSDDALSSRSIGILNRARQYHTSEMYVVGIRRSLDAIC